MRTLFVLRHAKSNWDDPSLDDHSRPLALRGRRAARAIAGHFRDEGIRPALVLCSSALRATQTLEPLLPEIAEGTTVRIEPALYGASREQLLERLMRTPDSVPSILVIGHNPGLEDLAVALAGGGDGLARLQEKFPTGALATLAFPGSWGELESGGAELVGYVVPRDLG